MFMHTQLLFFSTYACYEAYCTCSEVFLRLDLASSSAPVLCCAGQILKDQTSHHDSPVGKSQSCLSANSWPTSQQYLVASDTVVGPRD